LPGSGQMQQAKCVCTGVDVGSEIRSSVFNFLLLSFADGQLWIAAAKLQLCFSYPRNMGDDV